MAGFLFRFSYTCLFYLALPLIFVRLLWRSIKEPEYRRSLRERLGYYRSANAGDVIWVHAVSTGETIAAVPLIRGLTAAGNKCLVTNTTPSGRERTRSLLGVAIDKNIAKNTDHNTSVENCYAPWDLPGAVARFIRRNRPRMLVIIDTELWPNMIRQCHNRGIKIALVNGRMSAQSARGYHWIAPLSRPMMASISLIAAQTQRHRDRFVALGAPVERVLVTGSIKFDAVYPKDHQARLEAARYLTASRPLLTGASTHDGEEAALLKLLPSLQAAVPGALLLLAPRHPHRSDSLAQLIRAQGYEVARFSEGQAVTSKCQVLLLDVMGELEAFLGITRVAFVGGSLVPVGGHNLLEAVRAGAAVVMGPHLNNIDDIARQFLDQSAMLVVANEPALKHQLIDLMRQEDKARRMAQAATAVLALHSGALQKVQALLLDALE